jgi:acetolactate synthase-1/2/3 large subunit
MDKPVILIGNGLRGNPRMVDYLCSLNIPVLTTWMALDLVAEDNPAFCGRPGLLGQRAANIIQQKADTLYIFGARLDGDQTAYNYERFAPHAIKYVHDVDAAELAKLPDSWTKYNLDLSKDICCIERSEPSWLDWCKALHDRLDVFTPTESNYVDPFAVTNWLSEISTADDYFAISSSGQAPCVFLQAFRVKAGQRVSNISTYGAMGADIPMAIGACLGSGRRRTICVTGDGGFMLNVAELEVVRRLQLPIKFLVYNNNGYNSIRQMQRKRFNGRLVAADDSSGFTTPMFSSIASTFDIDYAWCGHNSSLNMTNIMSRKGPSIIEFDMDPEFVQYPRVDSSMGANGVPVPDPMEDMTPHLPADELRALMEWGNSP